jgi:ceramide glucosyltransferase
MVLVGARRFRREAVRQDVRLGKRPEFLPAISLFKPLHGDEMGLEANLRTFFKQDYLQHVARAEIATAENSVSRLEVLFCARSGAGDREARSGGVSGDHDEVCDQWSAMGGQCEGLLAGGDGEGGDS